MKKFELNVVNFDNEDVIVTSHENCIGLVFSVDDPVQTGTNHVHYHVNFADGGTFEVGNRIDVDGDGIADYVAATSSDAATKGNCINVVGITTNERWNINDANQTEAEAFADSLSGHYILVGDVYTKE